jgi:hypothetical protein
MTIFGEFPENKILEHDEVLKLEPLTVCLRKDVSKVVIHTQRIAGCTWEQCMGREWSLRGWGFQNARSRVYY